jgi:hypothetical protein
MTSPDKRPDLDAPGGSLRVHLALASQPSVSLPLSTPMSPTTTAVAAGSSGGHRAGVPND